MVIAAVLFKEFTVMALEVFRSLLGHHLSQCYDPPLGCFVQIDGLLSLRLLRGSLAFQV